MPAEELTVDDESATVALWEAAGLTRPWNDPRADFRRGLEGATSTVLGVREGDALVGAAVVGEDGHRGWLYYVGVEPGHQGRGVGRGLVEAAVGWLGARGVPKALLMVRGENEAALSFDATVGFAEEDVVVLGRRLDVR